MELQRMLVEKDKLISELQAALKSTEGSTEGIKDAERSTHEATSDVPLIEFVSADSPNVPMEHADLQHIKRWIMQGKRTVRGSHFLCSPFIPLPSTTSDLKRKPKKNSVHRRDDDVA
ncbi:uncharacterized protein [Elaeis guineensis]|uniref:uncharacterized protein n=1 Tax=Elaeis guineensis var. tenera TaxID=51953 RepID=UPI003C6D8967